MKRILLSATLTTGLMTGLANPGLAQGLCDQNPERCEAFQQLMGRLLERVDPLMEDLTEMMGDLSGWHAPEVLENGDILIRRRRGDEDAPETDDHEDGAVLDPLEL